MILCFLWFSIALNCNTLFPHFHSERYSFADTSFRIVLSLEFYLGTALWFRFCLAPVAVYLGLTNSLVAVENIDWMGSLVLGFSHTTAFAFGNFLYQDYYRRGFDKKPEYAFIKYYSIYGSIFVIGRMTTQVLCSMRSKLLLLFLYVSFDGVREHSGGLVILSWCFCVHNIMFVHCSLSRFYFRLQYLLIFI